MTIFAISLWLCTTVLEAILLFRGWQGKYLSRLPLFFSYVAFLFSSTGVLLPIYFLYPQHYLTAFWFRFMIQLVAEFCVLLEISDYIFSPFVAIRRLGRLLTFGICATFSILYIGPSVVESQPSILGVMELVKRASLTKAVIIAILVIVVRSYRLQFGRNISGILQGFTAYLAITVVNLALVGYYGPGIDTRAFSLVGSLGYAVSLLIWVAALWHYEPVPSSELAEFREDSSETLAVQLGKFDTTLGRVLRR